MQEKQGRYIIRSAMPSWMIRHDVAQACQSATGHDSMNVHGQRKRSVVNAEP